MSKNVDRKNWGTSGDSLGASVNHDEDDPLKGSHRSGVVGSDNGTAFMVKFGAGVDKPKAGQIPKRLQQYQNKKKLSEEDIMNKHKLAEERKKRFDENRAKQAREASEEAVREYDRLLELEKTGQAPRRLQQYETKKNKPEKLSENRAKQARDTSQQATRLRELEGLQVVGSQNKWYSGALRK